MNSHVAYTLADNDVFQINPVTGDVILRHALDRERTPGYTLTVTATDHGRPPKSDTTDIEVVVLDVNDNAPKFGNDIYRGIVQEDVPVGTSVLVVSATDSDVGVNGHMIYLFDTSNDLDVTGGQEDFSVDATLGIIRTARELDRERRAEYTLTLWAVDRGTPEMSTEVKVIITVDDVNDNAPQWETANIIMHIKENSPIGKFGRFYMGQPCQIKF